MQLSYACNSVVEMLETNKKKFPWNAENENRRIEEKQYYIPLMSPARCKKKFLHSMLSFFPLVPSSLFWSLSKIWPCCFHFDYFRRRRDYTHFFFLFFILNFFLKMDKASTEFQFVYLKIVVNCILLFVSIGCP